MASGHIAAYALTGVALNDGRHGWLLPALDVSAAASIALGALIVAGTLLRAGVFQRTQIESSLLALAPRLAASQLFVFGVVETLEGRAVTPAGIAAQLASALLAAYALSLFSRLVARCIACADEAGRYLERFAGASAVFAIADPAPRTVTLFATAGNSRFQRPPPFA